MDDASREADEEAVMVVAGLVAALAGVAALVWLVADAVRAGMTM